MVAEPVRPSPLSPLSPVERAVLQLLADRLGAAEVVAGLLSDARAEVSAAVAEMNRRPAIRGEALRLIRAAQALGDAGLLAAELPDAPAKPVFDSAPRQWVGPPSAEPPDLVVVEADGGSRGNPGLAGYGAVVYAAPITASPTSDDRSARVLAERWGFLGRATNNVAEYQGLIAGLSAARELGARRVLVRMDSELVVRQMQGRYRVRHAELRPLFLTATDLVIGFERVTFEWIPRELNTAADALANRAMDEVSAGG